MFQDLFLWFYQIIEAMIWSLGSKEVTEILTVISKKREQLIFSFQKCIDFLFGDNLFILFFVPNVQNHVKKE